MEAGEATLSFNRLPRLCNLAALQTKGRVVNDSSVLYSVSRDEEPAFGA